MLKEGLLKIAKRCSWNSRQNFFSQAVIVGFFFLVHWLNSREFWLDWLNLLEALIGYLVLVHW